VNLHLFSICFTYIACFGRPFVKRFALCYRTVVCLSVTLVYCSQTVGWIKMPLGTELGLGPGHIVLDRNPASPRKGAQQTPTFRPISIVAKRSPISATAKLLYLSKCQLLYDTICCHYVFYVYWRTSWICSPVFEAKCVQFRVQKFFWSFSTASCGYVCN